MTARRLGASILLVLAAVACGADDAKVRLERALARMESLRSVHFEMRASVRADSPIPEQQPAGGILNQELHASGDIAFPDRLHVVAPIGPSGENARELIVVGDRAWSKVGGEWRRIAAIGSNGDPRAALSILRGPGVVSFSGYGLNGGALTYHIRIDLDAAALAERQSRAGDALSAQLTGTGRFDVYVGIFDDRIYRQEVEIVERSATELVPGSALYRIRTSYGLDYSAFDQPVAIREPSPGP